MIIADTGVVSESMREQPQTTVLEWAGTLRADELAICVVTVEEIERGILRLPVGRRRTDLSLRWARLLAAFGDAIATYDVAAAQGTARLATQAANHGHTIALADAQIAGICISRGADLATRNVWDFAGVPDLNVVNPFEPG